MRVFRQLEFKICASKAGHGNARVWKAWKAIKFDVEGLRFRPARIYGKSMLRYHGSAVWCLNLKGERCMFPCLQKSCASFLAILVICSLPVIRVKAQETQLQRTPGALAMGSSLTFAAA